MQQHRATTDRRWSASRCGHYRPTFWKTGGTLPMGYAHDHFCASAGSDRETRGHVCLFCSLPYGFLLHETMQQAGWRFRFDLIWQKKNAGFQVSKKLPLPAHEYLFGYARRGVPARDLTFHGYEAGEQETRLVQAWHRHSLQPGLCWKHWLQSARTLRWEALDTESAARTKKTRDGRS